MFSDSYELTSLDVSKFNTSNVVNFQSMFRGCENLRFLDISNFITNKAKEMSFMFNRCWKLEFLDFTNFNTQYCDNIFEIVANTNLTIYLKDNSIECQNLIKEINNTVNIQYLDTSLLEELF